MPGSHHPVAELHRKVSGASHISQPRSIMDVALLVYLALWYLGVHEATHPTPKLHPADEVCARP